MRRLSLLIALCLIAARPLCGATPAQYDRALARVQAVLAADARTLARGGRLPAAHVPGRAAARLLQPILSVDRPGGDVRPVDSRPLLQSIHEADTRRDGPGRAQAYEAIGRQIAALRADLGPDAEARVGRVDAARAVESACAVLAGSAFQSDPFPPKSWDERLAEWLERTWNKWWHPRGYRGPVPHISPNLAKWLVIILAGGVFALLVALLVPVLGRRGARAAPLALDDAEAALVETRDTDSLLALAEQQARAGEFRRAFRLIYLATLVALDTSGVLRFDRSKTNWEYLRALRAAGRDDLYRAMSPMTRDFDRVWYGFAPADAADYARAVAQYQALRAATQAAAPASTA